MITAVQVERLKSLFEAFRENNDAAFRRAAESIILEQLAANHHVSATELRKALGDARNGKSESAKLNTLPKDRRAGEDLLYSSRTPVHPERLVLVPSTQKQIERVLTEYQRQSLLYRAGLRPKSKLLFWGPPGCGKTLTAHVVGRELGLPVGILRLSSVISSFVGDTAAHIDRVFTRAATAPMVLLLDEFDALGKNRDDPNDVGELKRVVNSLLQAIDTFTSSQSLVIAASNHQYLLDPALWRRFDDVINFPLPDKGSRDRYLRVLLSGIQVTDALGPLVTQTEGLSFADIERAVAEAIKTMLLENRSNLTTREIAAEVVDFRAQVRDATARRVHPQVREPIFRKARPKR